MDCFIPSEINVPNKTKNKNFKLLVSTSRTFAQFESELLWTHYYQEVPESLTHPSHKIEVERNRMKRLQRWQRYDGDSLIHGFGDITWRRWKIQFWRPWSWIRIKATLNMNSDLTWSRNSKKSSNYVKCQKFCRSFILFRLIGLPPLRVL